MLHAVSNDFFQLCTGYIRHIRKVAKASLLHEYKSIVDSTHFKRIPNRFKKRTAALNLKEIYFRSGINTPLAYCLPVDLDRLRAWEVSRLIKEYKNDYSYRLYLSDDIHHEYRCTAIQAESEFIENFCRKDDTNLIVIFKFLISLRQTNNPWAHSIDGFPVLREIPQQHNCKRRYASQFDLRVRTTAIPATWL